MIVNKKFFVIITLLVSLFVVSNVDAARNIAFYGESLGIGLLTVGVSECPAGYQFVETQGFTNETICQRVETCDQYGNGWPIIGMDTETDARFTLCGTQNLVTATLTANPINVYSGQSSTLAWNSTNSTFCSGNGFITGGGTSGSILVYPSTFTNYSVTCTGETGSAIVHAEVAVGSGIDFVPSKPSLKSGSLIGEGNQITFKSIVTNMGGGNVTTSIPTLFELDINNDGSYDLTLTSNYLSGLNGGQSKEINSSGWTTILGTHAIRAVADLGETIQVSEGEDGCYIASSTLWTEQIGTEGCSTQGGPNACGLQFDPQSYYATIGTTFNSITPTTICPEITTYDLGIGTETGSFDELRQANMQGTPTVATISNIISPGSFIETNELNNYSPNYVFTVSSPQCSDGIDNDNDGFIDYPADSNCSSGSGEGSFSEGNITQCSDGIDNDGDGTTDLLDEGCATAGDDNESDDPISVDPQVDISVSTTLVRKGTNVMVSWTASDVNSCVVNGPSLSRSYSTEEVNDQTEVEINSKNTYTITCDTEVGAISDSVTVGIVPSFIEE